MQFGLLVMIVSIFVLAAILGLRLSINKHGVSYWAVAMSIAYGVGALMYEPVALAPDIIAGMSLASYVFTVLISAAVALLMGVPTFGFLFVLLRPTWGERFLKRLER